MRDRETRQKVLQDGTFKKYAEMRRKTALNGDLELIYNPKINNDTGEIIGQTLNPDFFGIERHELEECERARKCRDQQRRKIEDHISFIFGHSGYQTYFATFTFKDSSLDLKADTRRQRIRRLLSKTCDDFILNIDYGSETDREHYHALIALKEGHFNEYKNEMGHLKIKELDGYKLGNYDIEKVRDTEKDGERLARYVAKLTLHSVKVKQSYVSVKKGSDYQSFKTTKKGLMTSARDGLGFWRNWEDELNSSTI